MRDADTSSGLGAEMWALFFWAFLAIKLVGTSLAGWSWWWAFLPSVPVLSILVERWGL